MLNTNSDLELYVGEAIHKTHIDLNENGKRGYDLFYFHLIFGVLMI